MHGLLGFNAIISFQSFPVFGHLSENLQFDHFPSPAKFLSSFSLVLVVDLVVVLSIV